jgi:hypothetical protein
MDFENIEQHTIKDGMLINFKIRSDTCKVVKESNMQVEIQTKSNDVKLVSHR